MKKLFVFSYLFLLTACGTLFSGSTQTISIDANVKEVFIFDNGKQVCATPCIYRLPRKHGEKTLIAKKEGYGDNRLLLGSSVNPIALLDIFSTYGFTTDGITGAIWEYAPNNFYVNMMLDEKNRRRLEMKQREIRRYILKNYDALKIEVSSRKSNIETLRALSHLTNMDIENLKLIIKDSVSAVLLAEEISGQIKEQE